MQQMTTPMKKKSRTTPLREHLIKIEEKRIAKSKKPWRPSSSNTQRSKRKTPSLQKLKKLKIPKLSFRLKSKTLRSNQLNQSLNIIQKSKNQKLLQLSTNQMRNLNYKLSKTAQRFKFKLNLKINKIKSSRQLSSRSINQKSNTKPQLDNKKKFKMTSIKRILMKKSFILSAKLSWKMIHSRKFRRQ